ncbi:hypothetical protein FSARC_8282 [Fusarium sarcochroum]|uniref:Uncharacterized protein n=1 Tax=Fusarium sarcochroum TaxID=1208366 RepID=A0A8H4TTP6_9HYPO|nr:hypothetical protein FSARC_8282 [Fusarium sarcochroum]
MQFFLISILSFMAFLSISGAATIGTRDLKTYDSPETPVDTTDDVFKSVNGLDNAAELMVLYNTYIKPDNAINGLNVTAMLEDYTKMSWRQEQLNEIIAASTAQSPEVQDASSVDKRCSPKSCANFCRPWFLIFTVCFLGCSIDQRPSSCNL